MRHQRAAAGWSSSRGSRGGHRPYEEGGVEAGPSEVAQPLSQLWHGRVCGGAGDLCGEQPPRLAFCVGIGLGESSIEFLLPDSGGAAELEWPGGSPVVGFNLGGCAPHPHVGDQLRGHESLRLGRPRRRLTCGVEAYVLGEVADQTGSGVQVWSPVGVRLAGEDRPAATAAGPGVDLIEVRGPRVDERSRSRALVGHAVRTGPRPGRRLRRLEAVGGRAGSATAESDIPRS
jgi:hypothetical protein